VAGSSNELNLPDEINESIKIAIREISKTPNTFLITGGTDCGITKLVGEATDEEYSIFGWASNDLIVMGITTWGIIAKKEEMIPVVKVKLKS
jgi:hypothetical protein